MATPMTPDRLVAVLRAEGLKVVEVRDWRNHNRNHKGPWGPVNGVMIHHTVTKGSAATVDICYDGHSLPGPLCHGVITKDGTVHLVGNGRANHAGLGDGDVLKAVINETALPADNDADTDGNRHFYGFECENLGDGVDPWPAAQLLAIEKAAAAICRHHGWGSGSVIGHLEWQPGKVDPRGFTMQTMRGRVAARLDGNQQQEEDVALTADEIRKVAVEVLTLDGVIDNPNPATAPDNPHISLETSVRNIEIVARRTEATLTAQVAALSAALGKLAAGGGLDAAEIQAAAEAGAQAALDQLGDALTKES